MVERSSEFAYTSTFSLNNYYGDTFVGAAFNTPNINVVPVLVEWNLGVNTPPSGFSVDPSGLRHVQTHPAFKQVLASGRDAVSSTLGPLDFAITNISQGSGISCTRCMMFRVAEFDCPTTRVSDMKVWASDLGDFLTPQTFEILFDTRRGNAFPSGFEFDVQAFASGNLYLPRSIPELSNLKRQDGGNTIHASGDLDVSEYVLLAVASSGTTPLGEYVGDPDGFQIRVTYDIDNLFNLFD